MSVISAARKQRAVWWEKTGETGSGQPIYAQPVEVKCRWDDVQVEFIDLAGNNTVSNSRVAVDRRMKPGDVLWEGKLEDLVSQTDPLSNENAAPIRGFNRVPNFKATETYMEALL
jgi:hypothetical protein